MILAIPSPTRFYCDRPACLVAAVDAAVLEQTVARVWRVPLTARCAACGCDLYAKATGQEQKVLEATQ